MTTSFPRPQGSPIYPRAALRWRMQSRPGRPCVHQAEPCEPPRLPSGHTGPRAWGVRRIIRPMEKGPIDDPDLYVSARSMILILRNAGPQGGPGNCRMGACCRFPPNSKQGRADMVAGYRMRA